MICLRYLGKLNFDKRFRSCKYSSMRPKNLLMKLKMSRQWGRRPTRKSLRWLRAKSLNFTSRWNNCQTTRKSQRKSRRCQVRCLNLLKLHKLKPLCSLLNFLVKSWRLARFSPTELWTQMAKRKKRNHLNTITMRMKTWPLKKSGKKSSSKS